MLGKVTYILHIWHDACCLLRLNCFDTFGYVEYRTINSIIKYNIDEVIS